MTTTERILAQLDPYWDRIARRPLDAEMLARVEAALDIALPACLRTFLMTVGFFQDLTNVTSNAVLVFESVTEYAAARRDLLDGVYGEVNMRLLPFGHNGAGDVFALLAQDDDADIHFMRQDATGDQPTGTTFNEWLRGVVAETIAQIGTRSTNRDKVWSVQFTFRGADFGVILELMEQAGQVDIHSPDWENVEALPAGVRKATARLAFQGLPITVKRLEYPHWVAPWYFFDIHEPLDTHNGPSTIQRLDTLFFGQVPGYGMINHGAVTRV